MKYTSDLEEQLLDAMYEDIHIVFSDHEYRDGTIRIKADKHRQQLLHRYLYKLCVDPELTGRLKRTCDQKQCVNPLHYTPERGPTKPRPSRAKGGMDAAAINRAKTHCPQGHAYTPENTYTYAMRRKRKLTGSIQRKCRTCAIDRARKQAIERKK